MISDLRGKPLRRIEELTNLHDLSDLLEQIVTLVRQSTKEIKTAGPLVALTVGVSAAWNPHLEQLYSAPNLPLLENVNLLQHLKSLLKDDCAISVDNDINFAALGEYAYGAAKGCPNFFYLNLGSGIGGGVVVEGRLHRGVQGFAGELGTLPIFVEGQFVRLEQVIAHQALSQRVRELGLATDIWDFLANFDDESPLSEDFAREVGTHVALGLGAVIAVLNPALIVIGGGLGQRFDALMPYMITALSEFMPVCPPIVTTALGNEASLLGAISQGIERAREFLLIKELA
jgi:predicted NBD/HSP70 family sugar kinase